MGEVFADTTTAAGAAVNAIVGNDIYLHEVPEKVNPTTTACLVFGSRGGSKHPNTPMVPGSWWVRCYGGAAGPLEALTLYDAVRDVLADINNKVVASGRMVSCVEVRRSGGQIERDPDTDAWMAFGFFETEIVANG